jgi:GAF domain-containing protein
MITRVREVLVASAARAWLSTSSGSWRRLPQPVDEPHVHASGDEPHRVLILGNGVVMSYGVLSHQIGLGGHFARQLSERTGRGSDVLLMVGREFDARSAAAALAGLRPARFDAIVLAFGGAESIRLMPAIAWRQDLDALLDRIIAETSRTEIIVLGVPELGRVVRLPRFALSTVVRRIAEVTQHAHLAAAARDRTTFVPFVPRGTDLVRTRDRTTYEEWGTILAIGVADRLGSTADHARAVESVDEHDRVFALTELGVLDTPPDVRFAQITETARALFGVATASINFIDEHRQWTMTVSGGAKDDVPRADAFCDLTIQRQGLFVVNDALAHPRFKDLPMVLEGRVRFYAGYPIETPNGIRIGALCLMDPTPRGFTRADEALLRELALRVQAVFGQGAVA